MQHILSFEQINEGFGNPSLPALLDNIPPKAKTEFMKELVAICKEYNLKMGSLGDSISYMSLNKALAYKTEYLIKDECNECDNEGMIERPWGKGKRKVICPICEGKNKIIFPKKGNPLLLKFWFDKEGFNGVTKYDGSTKIRSVYLNKNIINVSKKKVDGISWRKSDFLRHKKSISIEELKEMEPLTTVFVSCYHEIWTLARLWIDNNTPYLVFYTEPDFNNIRDVPGISIYGSRYNHCLSNGRHNFSTRLAVPKDGKKEKKEKEKKEKTPDEIKNELVSMNPTYSEGKRGKDSSNIISKSQYAIVLDMGKAMNNSLGYDELRKERKSNKKGALALKKDDTIRKENIDNLLSKLAERFNLTNGLVGIGKNMKRLFNNKHIFCLVMDKRFNPELRRCYDRILYLIRRYHINVKDHMLSNVDKNVLIAEKEELQRRIKVLLIANRKFIDESINYRTKNDEYMRTNPSMIPFYEIYDNISNIIRTGLMKNKMESLEDIEIFLTKLEMINYFINRGPYMEARHYLNMTNNREFIRDIINKKLIDEMKSIESVVKGLI